MNDVLDQNLRDHGRSWAATQAAPPPFDDAMASATTQRDHRVLLAAAAAVVVVLIAVGVPLVRSLGAESNHTPAPGVGALGPGPTPTAPTVHSAVHDSVGRTLRELMKRARSAAIANEDPGATAEAVRTTYGEAQRVAFDGSTSSSPPADTGVWVLELHGTFTCTDCSIPAGADPPTGRALVFVLGARTLSSYGFALIKQPRDLTKLGNVIQLPI